jgi:hypothetical protein
VDFDALSGPTACRALAVALGGLLDTEQDLDTLGRPLAERVPVSTLFAVARDDDVFKFNVGKDPLYYSAELDSIAVMRVDGPTLEIEDLVAATLPFLDALLSQIDSPIDDVVIYFRPDRLGVTGVPVRFRYDGDVLMLRGELPEDGESPRELMLPPMARH